MPSPVFAYLGHHPLSSLAEQAAKFVAHGGRNDGVAAAHDVQRASGLEARQRLGQPPGQGRVAGGEAGDKNGCAGRLPAQPVGAPWGLACGSSARHSAASDAPWEKPSRQSTGP
mmetsp:Transcript_48420/g.156178  ORF Transcript_48420/g.156178 Transcript_48420/m.156178 type:complete len:114 (+) Transcript_48420:375-716(+)